MGQKSLIGSLTNIHSCLDRGGPHPNVHGGKDPGLDILPGDWVDFSNPDARSAVWRYENAIYLGGGEYFAHPFGIKTKEQILEALRNARKPGGTTPPFLRPGAVDCAGRITRYLHTSRGKQVEYGKEVKHGKR